jgi:FlaA1/EpsC-like NDP-sugar epimerase
VSPLPNTLTAQREAPPAELLLGRPEFAGDLDEAARWTTGKRVLLTGAAGSVGAPLSRLLVDAQPRSLVLLDHHEYSLFTLERSLRPAPPSVTYELADIRDARRLQRVIEQHRPEIVIHLAAAKHVAYGERFPDGAVETNLLATARLLELAREAGVSRFVYPSSDKSVAPPSLYGATKRLCEALVQSTSVGAVVRYVNIIGTRGSVIEIFTSQLRADRPLSVTDERMTRYWISMNEALWSLLVAGQRGRPGEVLMPDCGAPVPLLDTARRLSGWYRPELSPYPIQWTGMAPGERLHEVLLSRNESLMDGPAAGVHVVATQRDAARLSKVPAYVDELRTLVEANQGAELKQRALELAEALQ